MKCLYCKEYEAINLSKNICLSCTKFYIEKEDLEKFQYCINCNEEKTFSRVERLCDRCKGNKHV